MSKVSRRDFVRGAAGAGVGFTIVPRHVLGRGYQAPSDTLNVACIGVGGMGRSDVRGMSVENIYALCDVDLRAARSAFGAYPSAKRYRDFRHMLETEGENIDVVTVSTPDHCHAAASIMAMRMGKPTYCQKPLARTIGEVRAVMRVAAESGVATQMGNQGHAGDGTREIREWVEAGAIGTVREVHYWTNRPIWPQAIDRPSEAHNVPPTLDWNLWLGPAPERPYNPAYAPFRWRGWWDYGTGALGDIAAHSMDAAFWVLNLGYPSHVAAESTTLYTETAPRASRIEYDFPAKDGRAAIRVVWRDGSLGPARPPEVSDDELWPLGDVGGQLWIGDDGKLLADTYGNNPRLLDSERDREIKENPPAEKYPRTDGVHAEFIEAAKAGTTGGSDFVTHAGPLTQMLLLGNLSVRSGRVLELDPANGEILNANIQDAMINPTYRDGWSYM